MGIQKSPKVSKKNVCEYCNYTTSKISDYTKHLSTDKHQKKINDSKMVGNGSDLSPKVARYKCHCGKIYKYDSGYYRHKKKCSEPTIEPTVETKDESSDKDLIMMLVKQNAELLEVIKNGTHNTNSHNKTFNLQFFLNETCKDAMNLMDFVDSIKLQLTDLEKVGKNGYVEGISNIITTNFFR